MIDTQLIFTAIGNATAVTTLITIFLGTIWGVIIGALPGLGSILAIAICLPFTYSMTPTTAIALILSVYSGSVYGGSISAILMNTPGTPAAAATTFDGFPLSKKGKSNEALGWATSASLFGGLFSCVVLMFLGPALAQFALRFGPLETALFIIFALFCIVNSRRDIFFKGLFSTSLGLMFASVGVDPLLGEMRFTFGSFDLSGGFALVPVVIGVFALSEVFFRLTSKKNESQYLVNYTGIKFPSLKQWKGRGKLLVKSACIGCGIGILPGAGSSAAVFLSYANAKTTSPNKDKFGTGEPDGIIAPEAANNAVTGGALVPTLALGIPGDAVTAIMLVSLTIFGITPGVRLMQDNPDIVYTLFIVLILANIAMFACSVIVCRIFAFCLKIPEPFLMTLVIILCCLGAYGVQNRAFDLYVTLGCGVLGYVLRHFRFPLAPLVISLVLGQQLEITIRQTIMLSREGFWVIFWQRPIAITISFFTIIMLTYPFYKNWRRKSSALKQNGKG
jgi:putative tricarboxylic transport membrane protein